MSLGSRSLPSFPKFTQHSRVLPGPERIHQSILVKPNEPVSCEALQKFHIKKKGLEMPHPGAKQEVLEYPPDESATTIFELLQRAVVITDNGKFIGERDSRGDVHWIHYKQALDDAQRVGSGLLHLGVEAGESNRVGIAGLNSSRYMIAQYALISYSIVIVPLYHNYKIDALCEIINSCRLEVIFCDTVDRAETFVERIDGGSISTLKMIIVMKSASDFRNGPHRKYSQIEVYDWEHIITLGNASLKPVTPPAPSSIYIICHTSGTTGTPKGVQLSHRALVASMAGLYVQWCVPPHSMCFDNSDIHLSFLSLAHIYEQLLELFMIYVGGRVAVFGGDIRKLFDDMAVFRPTVVALVPRLLNRFHEKILQEIARQNPIKRLLFEIAVKTFQSKLKTLSKGEMCFDSVWDKLVFSKIRAKFGGNLRLLTTGGAPVSVEVMRFSRIAYGCPVFEGYGQTECSAAGTITLPFDVDGGHVGGPAAWAEIKLVDVDELEYSAEKDIGEVCFRGAALMNGYFSDPELTSKVVDEQGWLHTGDIGEWLSNGSLRIIGRRNNFFKLAQGDFVSPEQVENVYLQHPIVKQIFVYGSSQRVYLVAIIVVDVTLLRNQYATSTTQHEKAIDSSATNSLLSDAGVRKKFLLDLRKLGSNKGLTGIEQIRNLYLTADEFTSESGLLTPTLKTKRLALADKFAENIEQLYLRDLSI